MEYNRKRRHLLLDVTLVTQFLKLPSTTNALEALTPLPKHPASAGVWLTPRRGSSLAGGTAAYASSPPKLTDHLGSVAEHKVSRRAECVLEVCRAR